MYIYCAPSITLGLCLYLCLSHSNKFPILKPPTALFWIISAAFLSFPFPFPLAQLNLATLHSCLGARIYTLALRRSIRGRCRARRTAIIITSRHLRRHHRRLLRPRRHHNNHHNHPKRKNNNTSNTSPHLVFGWNH